MLTRNGFNTVYHEDVNTLIIDFQRVIKMVSVFTANKDWSLYVRAELMWVYIMIYSLGMHVLEQRLDIRRNRD